MSASNTFRRLLCLTLLLGLFFGCIHAKQLFGRSRATNGPLVVRMLPHECPFSSRNENLAWFLKNHFHGVSLGDMQVVSSMPKIFGDKSQEIVTFKQTFHGIPVEGAGMKVIFDNANKIVQVSCKIVDRITLNHVPTVSKEVAMNSALYTASLMTEPSTLRHITLLSDMQVEEVSLKVYRTGLTSDYIGDNHLIYQVQLRSASSKFMKYSFLVDAHTGIVIGVRDVFKGSMYREVRYYPSTTPYWVEGDSMPVDDFEATSFLNAAGDYYTTLYNMYQWRSFDNQDSALIGNVYMVDFICPNAYFSPEDNMTYFCTGLARFDIATHELGHALTSCLDNGVYEYMSGALQEAFSDTIAETFSQFWNGSGYYEPRSLDRKCLDTVTATEKRWICGDDCEMFDDGLRDLYNPTCYGNPELISELICYPYDMNGVHDNCGPPSVLFALLADGGYFHGPLFNGIGLLKAWHIFFQAKYEYQTSSETFSEYATHLKMACQDLLFDEAYLIDQFGQNTTQHVTQDDCVVLESVIGAIGMDDQPCSEYTLWGAYPSYVPTSGGATAIYTSGCEGCTTYMKIQDTILAKETQPFTFYGTTSGWNQYAGMILPAFAGGDRNVNYAIASDADFETTPALNPDYSLPMTITYYDQPKLDSLDPSFGDYTGGYMVSILGEGFQAFKGPCSPISGFDYDCLACVWWNSRFPTMKRAGHGYFVSEKEVQCEAPAVPNPGTWNVTVTLNLHSEAPTSLQFVFQ
ncbi:Zn-dependent metalloprotease [Pelomyxa schiedti]|nr:Zn-dependent metalloprotease [Pelomyxa schiedti]